MTWRKEYKREWYHDRKFVRDKKAWYAKLAEEGFYDIEGGVEGHLLKGPTPSRRLYVMKQEMDGLRSRGIDVDKVMTIENELVNYLGSHKAGYYRWAQLLAAQAFRTRELAERCWVWMLHSQGLGERSISTELGCSRNRVRGHVGVLKRTVNKALTLEVERGMVEA